MFCLNSAHAFACLGLSDHSFNQLLTMSLVIQRSFSVSVVTHFAIILKHSFTVPSAVYSKISSVFSTSALNYVLPRFM